LDKRWPRTIAYSILADKYEENLWELVSATSKFTPQFIVETNLRSQEGTVIDRPLGSPKKFPSLDQVMFNIGQLHVMPTPLTQYVDTKVVIGRACQRPLAIDLPIKYLILQYNRGNWSKSKEILRQADAVEIQFGQGAYGGTGHKVQANEIDNNLRKHFGLLPGQDIVI